MKIRRITSLMLSMLFFLAALTAYAETAKTEQPVFEKPIEISIANWDIESNLANSENDALFQSLLKRLNITIKPVNITWDDYVDKVNIWAASGQLPDLFSADKASSITYREWAEQGVIHAIPDDLSQFPYLAKALSPSDVQSLKLDGKLYCIPKGVYDNTGDWCMDQTMLYRWDWAQQLGITEEPDTWAEYEAMLAAFANSDPEGKGNPVGVVPKNPTYLFVLQSVWNPARNWVKEDGKWLPVFLSKQELPGIKKIKEWYDAGLIDKDFALLKGTEAEDKFLSGRAGAFLGGATPSDLVLLQQKWDQNYPDKDMLEACKVWHVPASPDGVRYGFAGQTYWSEVYINAKVSDEKLERILYLADYMLSPEGFHYSSGILGVDYTLDENGKATPIVPGADMGAKYPTILCDGGIPKLFNWVQNLKVAFEMPEYSPELKEFAKAGYDWYAANTIPWNVDFTIENLKTPGMNTLVMVRYEDFPRLVMTEGDIDADYKAIVDDYLNKGLDVVIEEVNAEAAKLDK